MANYSREGRVCLSITMQPPSIFFPLLRPVVPLLTPRPPEYNDKDAQADALGVSLVGGLSLAGIELVQVFINDDPN